MTDQEIKETNINYLRYTIVTVLREAMKEGYINDALDAVVQAVGRFDEELDDAGTSD